MTKKEKGAKDASPCGPFNGYCAFSEEQWEAREGL